MDPEVKEILEQFDEPGAYEYPRSFNYAELDRKAKLVNQAIRASGCETSYEGAGYNQDASFSVSILLIKFSTKSAGNVWNVPGLRFSNFGNLVSLTLIELVPSEIVEKIRNIVQEQGFTYLPEEALDAPYDGVMTEKNVFSTWWIRYFDWL